MWLGKMVGRPLYWTGTLLVAMGAKLAGVPQANDKPLVPPQLADAPCDHGSGSRYRNPDEDAWRCTRCGQPVEMYPDLLIRREDGEWIDPIDAP